MKREARRLGLLQLGDEDEQEGEEEEVASDGLSLSRELSPLADPMKRLHLPQLGLAGSSPSSSRCVLRSVSELKSNDNKKTGPKFCIDFCPLRARYITISGQSQTMN